jgi:hypothetical protein
MVAAVARSNALERERDTLTQSIISLEDQFNRGGTTSMAEYLQRRHELEQRLIQVMDELTRLTFTG